MGAHLSIARNAKNAGKVDASPAHALHDEVVRIEPHVDGRGDFAGVRPADGAVGGAIGGEITVEIDGRLVNEDALRVDEDSLEALGGKVKAEEERVVHDMDAERG